MRVSSVLFHVTILSQRFPGIHGLSTAGIRRAAFTIRPFWNRGVSRPARETIPLEHNGAFQEHRGQIQVPEPLAVVQSRLATVQEHMSPAIITLSPEMALDAASCVLHENHITGAPVVEVAAGGKSEVIGMLSQTGIKALASPQWHPERVDRPRCAAAARLVCTCPHL
jgi:hypothetical protein